MACLNICELLRQIEICLLELLRFWADDEQTRSYSGPQVRFEEVGSQSDVFQTQVVIHRMSQFLFAAQIMLGRLNRYVPKQELNLIKFSPSQVAQSRASAAQIMRSEILNVGTFRSGFDDVPDGFRREPCAPYLF